jgi:hypothetical protein
VHILADRTESGLTKPSKPSSVCFEGAASGEFPEIDADPDARWKSRSLWLC